MGELGSEDWDRLESPRVNILKLGLEEAMVAGFLGRGREDVAVGWRGRGGRGSPAGRRLEDKAGRVDGLRRSCSKRSPLSSSLFVVERDGNVPGGSGRSQKGNREVAGCRMV